MRIDVTADGRWRIQRVTVCDWPRRNVEQLRITCRRRAITRGFWQVTETATRLHFGCELPRWYRFPSQRWRYYCNRWHQTRRDVSDLCRHLEASAVSNTSEKGDRLVHEVQIDLHGYHPDDICGEPLTKMITQAWEMGADSIRFIHGHGYHRGISPGFVNTNTGYFGLSIRRELRHDEQLRRWIKHSTLDCSHNGSTVVKLKPNPNRTRTEFDDIFPKSSVQRRRERRWS